MNKTKSGFTIVELLIVIVVIGILAAITAVAYNGVQSRARDAQRLSDMNRLQKSVELYYAENGFYPLCVTNTSCTSTGWSTANDIALLTNPPLGRDPLNANGAYGYYYARNYKKSGPNTFTLTNSDQNYIIGTRLENPTTPTYNGWNNPNLNYLQGTS